MKLFYLNGSRGDDGLHSDRLANDKSICPSIVNCAKSLVISGQNFLFSFSNNIANGLNVLFWKDKAVGGGVSLKDLYPRL